MDPSDGLLAAVVIGAAASLAAMIGPFRRGFAGVLTNALSGTVGAVAGALIGRQAFPGLRDRPLATFAWSAAGALLLLVAAHVEWLLRRRRARSSRVAGH